MAQQTNLNVYPYFDDFDANNDYYKILFKPGYPVQARELTSLQSILQNQIETFGKHLFKDGAKVIPGNTTYNNKYHCVELVNTYQGIPVSAYAEQLVGVKIQGQTSGVTAFVDKILLPEESERNNLTLYINYSSSSTQNNLDERFLDGETLITTETISSGLLGNETIESGSPFAITIANNATSIGSAFSISEGVYFIRGYFVPVKKETLILDQYSNNSNYSVGLYVTEEIVTADEDESLNDNSQGFNNYGAPGADRLKLTVGLFKKPIAPAQALEEILETPILFPDAATSLVELATVVEGQTRTKPFNEDRTILSDELARRTYAESGHYIVKQFDVSLKESLNDKKGNDGLFNDSQITSSGQSPSENLALYQVSPGKAFVKGYEIETLNSTFLSAPKPRTTKTLENQSLIYNTGPTFKLNNLSGAPQIGIGNTYIISLRDERVGDTNENPPGKEIGVARLYDYSLSAGSYSSANKNTNEWDISLYDLQTTTEISLNYPVNLNTPVHIVGSNSGASGFLKESVSDSTTIILYNTNGTFIKNESFTFNGIESDFVAVAVTSYSTSNVKSIYGVGTGITFSADVVQEQKSFIGIATVGAIRFFRDDIFLHSTLTETVGIGSTQIFVIDTSNVSIGKSISIGTSLVKAPIVGVGNTFVYIDGDYSPPSTTLTTTVSSTVGFGSTTIYVDNLTGVLSGVSSITIGSALQNVSVVSVGDTFVNIGIADTSDSPLETTITTEVPSGAIDIYVGIVTGVVAFDSVISVGIALTDVQIVAVGNTFVTIGAGDTSPSSISVGTAVTFGNVSSMISGSSVTFSEVSSLVDGDIATFTERTFASKITSISPSFSNVLSIIRKNDIISYTDSNLLYPVYAKVADKGSNFIEVKEVSNVSGINSSILPSETLNIEDLKLLTSSLNRSTDNTLYTVLPKKNISNVNLTSSTITIKKTYSVDIQNNELSSVVSAGTNEVFLPYDEERYALIRSDGSYENLSSDKFSFISGGSQIQIYNLGSNDIGCTLVATLRKLNPVSKTKIKNRVNSVLIDKSKYDSSGTNTGAGDTTRNDGLIFGEYPYGTRVQDQEICLNVSDIIQIHAIYESANTDEPEPPKSILSSITTPSATTSELIIGEEIIGQTSGAVAILLEKDNSTQISYAYKNKSTFKEGETILFNESKVTAIPVSLTYNSFDISPNFKFRTGNNSTFYGYSSIVRNNSISEPTKKIKVYFSNSYYDSADTGDLTTINSYSTFDYGKELSSTNSKNHSDILDIRPRVSDFDSSAPSSRSPFEFYGREFDSSGNSASNILAPNESIILSFSYYLGRIDRVFLSRSGNFQVKYGVPSEKPEKPDTIDESIEIATIVLPPYLYSTRDARIEYLDHKRYTMADIRKLEKRIRSLEYYTSLSLLESDTANLFIADSDGLSRFKSGFFVDNFTSFLAQEGSVRYKNSIDLQTKELRPAHYTTSIDLIAGPITALNSNVDISTSQPEGSNIRKSEGIITLDYAEVEWFRQRFGTRSESVTPFILNFWRGSMELSPASDVWIDTVRLDARYIEVEGNYASVLQDAVRNQNVDPQTGFAPTVWNAWETNWTGQTRSASYTSDRFTTSWSGWIATTDTIRDTLVDVFDVGTSTRTGTQVEVVEQIDNTSVGDRTVSRDIIPSLRSRNIAFVANGMKPNTRVYPFFDGIDVSRYCIPKLLEITMLQGVFQTGENVVGQIQEPGFDCDGINIEDVRPNIAFRIAQPNHRTGPYNSPVLTYPENPYTNQPTENAYSSTSTILNVDCTSLADLPQGTFRGWIGLNMYLIGQSSGAIAQITNNRLISDITATVAGSIFIPNPNIDIHPRFESGQRTFELINNEDNDIIEATTYASEPFTSSGTLETVQENIVSVRNARVEVRERSENRSAERASNTEVISSEVISTHRVDHTPRRSDPIAQSFFVDEEDGIFLTKCGVYFRTIAKDETPVCLQIRTVEFGTPTERVLPFSEIYLYPEQINTSEDGSEITFFQFKAPVYLNANTEYAVVLLSLSPDYSVFISRVNENDLVTQEFVSNQPTLGTLFKSQNSATWDASQWEDLKYVLYRADFVNNGLVEFYNPDLNIGNNQVAILQPNSLEMHSRKIRVGLSATISTLDIPTGATVTQIVSGATGNYVASTGISTGTLSVINAGIGYTPSSGYFSFQNVTLSSITGNGSGATANVAISNGVAIAATITNGGQGYKLGDVVEISDIGTLNVGRNARFTINSLSGLNEIIFDDVQGDFSIGAGTTLSYINNIGISTELYSSDENTINISNIIVENDGLHIKVNHKNHGMYSEDNYVEISKVEPDIRPTKLTTAYTIESQGALNVENASIFETFEGLPVSQSNPGYLIVGNEVIKYTSVVGNTIGGNIERGENAINYVIGVPVYKYELNNISLNRINKIHRLDEVTIDDAISFDHYHIKIDLSSDTKNTGRLPSDALPTLYQKTKKSTGGYNITASQNIPFEIVTPIIHNVTTVGTNIGANIRTVTGKSIDGNEIPFTDNGYENLNVNTINYLDSPRIICSKVNESLNLNADQGKSLNLRVNLSTVNSKVSPVIDTQRVSLILTSNRVNNPILDYVTDSRVNSLYDDPTEFQYVSKEISLETPASSIKILLNAHINSYSDIRAFYSISEYPNYLPIFTPFPGYNNIDRRDNTIIDIDNSDGSSDLYIQPSVEIGFDSREIGYKEYVFSVDNLPSFKHYRIKLISTSTNQVYVPRFKDLRVIALA